MDWIRGNTVGRGSSATVSVATSCQSGNIFAAKSVESSRSEMLQREKIFLSALSSPRIVEYMGCDITMENNKLMYNLMMEYAPAGTLYDAIRNQGGLQESRICQYTHQIVQGLEYLHSSGVVHCDIKSRNILITESGAKIADFGCARWSLPAAPAAMPIAGTPMFMAPEVARGEEQGCPADIWALGCTIIEMATGTSPWPNVNNPDSLSVLYRIAYSGESPDFPIFLSTKAKDFLSKCLQTDPKSRWTAKQLINHPFIQEFDSSQKQNQKSITTSPTSILDHRVWTSTEESESMHSIAGTKSSSLSRRIEGLWLNSRAPNWEWEETWITVRENVESVKQDKNVTYSRTVGDDLELQSCCKF